MAKQERTFRIPATRFSAAQDVPKGTPPIAKAVEGADEAHAIFAEGVARMERGIQEGRKLERIRLIATYGEDSEAVKEIDAELEIADSVIEALARNAYRAGIDLGAPDKEAFVLRGIVTTAQGKPAGSATVIASGEGADVAKAAAGTDGMFTLRIPVKPPGDTTGAAGEPNRAVNSATVVTIRIEPRSGPALQNADKLTPAAGMIAWREYSLPEAPGTPPIKKMTEKTAAGTKRR